MPQVCKVSEVANVKNKVLTWPDFWKDGNHTEEEPRVCHSRVRLEQRNIANYQVSCV